MNNNFYDMEREGRAAYQLPEYQGGIWSDAHCNDFGASKRAEDIGGNVEPDRIAANMAFSEWLDSQGDQLPLPLTFQEWLDLTGDAICE